MYRQGLFKAKCKLLAYRYKEIGPGTKYLKNSYEATATDTAQLIQQSQKLYLQKIRGLTEDLQMFNRTRLVEALREVSFLPS
jgi:hypothetical protein